MCKIYHYDIKSSYVVPYKLMQSFENVYGVMIYNSGKCAREQVKKK